MKYLRGATKFGYGKEECYWDRDGRFRGCRKAEWIEGQGSNEGHKNRRRTCSLVNLDRRILGAGINLDIITYVSLS